MGSYRGFEWDERKDAIHREKHGLPLVATTALLNRADFLVSASQKSDAGEQRLIGIGALRGRLITCVFVWRGRMRRIISIRYASRKERRVYQETQAR